MEDTRVLLNFQFASMPKILFSAGRFSELAELVTGYGTVVLLVTGGSSFRSSQHYEDLLAKLSEKGCRVCHAEVRGEPSVQAVDETVERLKSEHRIPHVVVGIGGGSVLDFGKAVSAMLREEGSVKDYLEGMETKTLSGLKIPYIAVPTTSGTGAEATKNAVISEVGKAGFKRSLRHDHFVPDVALIDPELMLSLPRGTTAACGIDALTQLIEAFVSTQASPMTDALCRSGLSYFKRGFMTALDASVNQKYDSEAVRARADVAYASLMSGIALANAGLGVVHGFASPIGGYYPVPHGVVCAALLPDCTKSIVRQLCGAKDDEKAGSGLAKYAEAGRLLTGRSHGSFEEDAVALVNYLESLVQTAEIPKLRAYGLQRADFEKIISGTGCKNSPTLLDRVCLEKILENQL